MTAGVTGWRPKAEGMEGGGAAKNEGERMKDETPNDSPIRTIKPPMPVADRVPFLNTTLVVKLVRISQEIRPQEFVSSFGPMEP